MGKITMVDFKNKEVRKFKEEPKISREEVNEAIDILLNFVKEDYTSKIEDTSAAEQVLLHEIEDGDEATLRANAEEILMNIKDIRNVRREAKECQEVKERIVKKFTKEKINELHHTLVVLPKKPGSSKRYYTNKLKRCSTDKEYLKNALLENMITNKKEEEA